jgi:hypothetical protein
MRLAVVSILVCGLWCAAACGARDRQESATRTGILREHIYARFGAPDKIEAFPAGPPPRPLEEGGGNAVGFPFEDWHYQYLEGVGYNVDLEFVDTCLCGNYVLVTNSSNAATVELIVKGE